MKIERPFHEAVPDSRVGSLDAFARSLAHQLNQPLTAIMANAQAALQMAADAQPDQAQLRETLADIVTDSRRAADVVRHLQTLVASAGPSRIQPPWNAFLTDPHARDHLVHLYRSERSLVEAVALFAGTGLRRGEAVVLVATPPHLEAVAQRMEGAGLDIGQCRRSGQLTVMDAATLLARFTVNGTLDAAGFSAIVGDMLETQGGGGHGLRVYGEMVNLLWEKDLAAASLLESLWNAMIERHDLSLLCSYCVGEDLHPSRPFPPELVAAHSRLVPVEACA